MNPQRIVIIGAALAGATAAVTLRDEGFDGEIQLIGAERQLPYTSRWKMVSGSPTTGCSWQPGGGTGPSQYPARS